VYFITPVLIAPLANVNAIVIKLANCPISAIPAGPVNNATTLLATKLEAMRIKVIIAEKKEVLISFKCPD
jgi:predicted metal-binding protein